LSFAGHAIEARIYAEDPERDFLPATGKLLHLAFPPETHDVRIDAGVEAGGEITPWYDPMIAKLIVRGPDRDNRAGKAAPRAREPRSAGVTTNVAFLGRVRRAATASISSATGRATGTARRGPSISPVSSSAPQRRGSPPTRPERRPLVVTPAISSRRARGAACQRGVAVRAAPRSASRHRVVPRA